MTIKKITTSVIAASLLASTAMAGTAATHVAAPTFNTVYTAAAGETVAIGDDVEYLELNVSSPLNNKNVLYVKLNNGTWAGTPTNYQVTYTNTDTSGDATVSAASVNADNELQFIISGTWAADTNGTVKYDGADDLNITMAADNTEDVTITTRGRDNENNIDLAGVETDTTTIAKAETTKITASVDCAKAVINSDTKNTFVVGTKVPSTTTATCDVNVSRPATVSDIDFNYEDANVTITMYAGNLTDGNITGATHNGTNNGNVSAVDGSEQVISMYSDDEFNDRNLSNDINTTLTYTLAGTATIADTTFQTAVSLGYPTGGNSGADNESPIAATDVYPQADSMTWELSTYAVTVLNMRNNDAGTVNTYVKLYNDDASLDATVNVTITTADGTALPSFELTDKVPSKGALTVSSKDIKEAYGSALDNGYSVVIGYAEVDKTRGNSVASLTDTAGKSPVRISHNRPGTAVADGYQGL